MYIAEMEKLLRSLSQVVPYIMSLAKYIYLIMFQVLRKALTNPISGTWWKRTNRRCWITRAMSYK